MAWRTGVIHIKYGIPVKVHLFNCIKTLTWKEVSVSECWNRCFIDEMLHNNRWSDLYSLLNNINWIIHALFILSNHFRHYSPCHWNSQEIDTPNKGNCNKEGIHCEIFRSDYSVKYENVIHINLMLRYILIFENNN